MNLLRRITMLALMSVLLLAVAGCQPVAPSVGDAPASQQPDESPTLVLASHDSLAVSEEVVAQFEAASGVHLQFLQLGDAGEALNKMILSKDAPLADLFFGVDNTFLSRALQAGIFLPYASPLLSQIPDALQLDAQNRLLPVDVGYINLNGDRAWFAERGVPLPTRLEDLIDPAYRGLLVVQNPATSSPGLAFLLATIAYFGEEGYLPFWQALRENDVLVTDGWSEAYFERFTVGSGGSGDRPLVVSYTSSPPADVLYATDGRTQPASVNINLAGAVFRQIEFVGIVDGTQHLAAAQALVDFMLGITFQEDMPLQMFVYPANGNADLPELFTQFAEQPPQSIQLDPATIEANREGWIQAWTDTMLR